MSRERSNAFVIGRRVRSLGYRSIHLAVSQGGLPRYVDPVTGSWSFHEQPRTGDTVLPTSDDAPAAELVPLAAQLPRVGTGDINGWGTIRTAGSAQVPTHRRIPDRGASTMRG